MFDFEECNLSDAEIINITQTDSSLVVRYLDWQENEHILEFTNVIAYQWFSPERKALSHGTIDYDEFLDTSCRLAEEDANSQFSVYSFVSAWSNEKILRITAQSVRHK